MSYRAGGTGGEMGPPSQVLVEIEAKTFHLKIPCTGKSLSEALILALTNPQHDKRLFIELPVQYKKTTCSEHVVYTNCSECEDKNKIQFVYTPCTELVVFLY